MALERADFEDDITHYDYVFGEVKPDQAIRPLKRPPWTPKLLFEGGKMPEDMNGLLEWRVGEGMSIRWGEWIRGPTRTDRRKLIPPDPANPSQWWCIYHDGNFDHTRFNEPELYALRNGAGLKGSVGEGPNQTNYSDQSSVRIFFNESFRNFH